MNKITNEKYLETYVEETLDNGLRVVLFHRPNYDKAFFLMGTPFGALDLEQFDDEQNRVVFPSGIAHFLEHKMFEDPKGDVMDAFSAMGVSVNAFTSYTETCYYFSSNGIIQEPLDLLLDFVQELHIDEASVEKEKGIIIQELAMYRQQSDSRLVNETFQSLYHNHPLKHDIGGDDTTVSATTLSQLEQCFALNYAPAKMILVGVSSENPEIILDWIKANQSKKAFPQTPKTKRVMEHEPKNVVKRYHNFAMDVSMVKANVAFKLDGIVDGIARAKAEWAFRFAMDATFSSLNPDYQNWIDSGIINDYFSHETEIGEDYGVILFNSETDDVKAFETLMLETLAKLQQTPLDETILEQLKKRYYGQSIAALNSFENTAIYYMRNAFAGVDFFTSLELIDQIDTNFVSQTLETIRLEDYSVVFVEPFHD
ncbi:MAG: EF-P 5-aminopentanol modification-associated protein YfmH [Erysipelotrichaceae bacterium]